MLNSHVEIKRYVKVVRLIFPYLQNILHKQTYTVNLLGTLPVQQQDRKCSAIGTNKDRDRVRDNDRDWDRDQGRVRNRDRDRDRSKDNDTLEHQTPGFGSRSSASESASFQTSLSSLVE